MTNCAYCNKETSNPKFCSLSCSVSFSNKQNPRRTRTNKCLDCDELAKDYRSNRCLLHHQAYIDARAVSYKTTKIGHYRNSESVKGKHPSWLNSHIRQFARSWNKDMTKACCEKCQYDKHVELAHIKSISDFNDDATLWEVNNPSNVISLCPNCHWEFDNCSREPFEHILTYKKLLEESYLRMFPSEQD